MSYIDTGGDKQVLVFLHGLSSRKESWFKQESLSNHFRLIIPDLRGHGDSEIEDNITMKTFSQDVINLLHKLKIKKASFCGLSLGGIVVQEILKRKPSIVDSIILSNTVSIIPQMLGNMTVRERTNKLNNMSDEEYIKSVSMNCLFDSHNERLVNEMCSDFFKMNRNTYIDSMKAPLGVNYASTLMFNMKPTLIIGSVNDKVTPYVNALTTKMMLPFAKMKTFNNCGHVPNIEKSEEFNNTVMKFLIK